MALGDRKSSDIFNKNTGASKDAKSIDTSKETEIKNKFDRGEHIEDAGMFENLAPVLYAIQQLTEDIEELRRYVTAEITSITSAQASAITANTAKITSPSWVPSSNPNYLTSSSTQSKYLRSDADDYFTGKLNWDGSDYADAINMSLGNINDAGFMKANEYRQRLSGRPRNNLGDPTVTEMALFEEQFGPKTTLANDYDDLSDLTFWSQETSSSDWVEVTSYSDNQKRKFLRTNNSTVVIPNTYYKFRVEFKAKSYTFANAVYMYWSSQSHNSQVHVWKKRCSDGAWLQHTSATNTISSWPGHGWIPFSNIPWHETNTTSTGHFTHVRVEFTPNWSGNATYGDRPIAIYGMQIWGGYPKGRRTPHYYDENGEFNFLKDAHVHDNKKLYIGTGGDLQLYHDGSNSYIDEAGTGNLVVRASSQLVAQKYTGETMFKGIADGAFEAYHNNVKKLETTNTGITVSGTVNGVNVGNIKDLYHVTSTGLDLDTLTTSGAYRFTGSTNNPFGTSHSTGIVVTQSTGDYGWQLTSKDSNNNSEGLAYRYRGTSWGPWQTIVTKTFGDGRYLLDSEVTNLAQVKAFDSSDYATAAQGTKADTAHGWGNHASAGYGTSNLALGTTSTTALAGDTVTITTAQAAILTNLANLPTRAGARGTFWNDRGTVKVS